MKPPREIGNPHISVIMACYNASLFIEKAIISVIQQTFKNLELIIVDDASTDNSLDLARNFADTDQRIKILSLATNSGAAAARNYAIQSAKGEWLAILDADDVFLPNKLERQLHCLNNARSDTVLIGTDSFQIDEHGRRLSKQCYPTSSQKLAQNLVLTKRFPAHSSIMYRASTVRFLGGFNESYLLCQDYDLWLRLSRVGSMISVPECLIEYRLHEHNVSKSNSGFENLKYGNAAAVCHFLRLNKHQDPSKSSIKNDWDRFLEWIANRLRELHYDEFIENKALAKKELYRSSNKLLGFMRLIVSLKCGRYLRILISEYLWGSRLPERLAKEWMNYPKAVQKSTDS